MTSLISLEEARSLGLKRFFTGRPCAFGHIAERKVSSRACMECIRRDSRKKLSAADVDALTITGRYGDGGGLELQVSKWGTKSWLFRYMRQRKTHWIGLGAYPDVSLEEARASAAEQRLLLRKRIDPLTNKKIYALVEMESAVQLPKPRRVDPERAARSRRRREQREAAVIALNELGIQIGDQS